jgi:flavin-dependent dehydrogenase
VIPHSFTHVIVGGGLSGSLALIELLRKYTAPISIAVLEESPLREIRQQVKEEVAKI